MSNAYEIVIAGGGIAGLTAGVHAARLGRKTLVLTGSVPGGHLLSIEKIEGMPGFPAGISGYELCPMVQEDAVAAGAEFTAAEVQDLIAADDNFRIMTGNGEYLAQAVILATGTRLRQLGVAGEEQYQGKGVSHCASCDGPMLRDRSVAVVGGGDSALQEALTLAEYAAQVTILQREGSLTAKDCYQRRVTAREKITIHTGTEIVEILGDAAVTGVRFNELATGGTETLEASAVFVYIGMQPNTEYLTQLLPLDQSGYVSTDRQMRTEHRGLFAAGILRQDSPGQAVSSAGEGAAAAITADRYLNDGYWPGSG